MSSLEIFMTNPIEINSASFYPRNYNPNYLVVKNGMQDKPTIQDYIFGKINGGSTPPAYLFRTPENGVPFIKTAAVTRHYININDLQSIAESFHKTTIKRSITHPYDIIFTMTGKFMGKAAMCPCIISEMNMSQNSVVFHNESKEKAAFLTIFLNSQINRIQIRGIYSITKQKFLNQSKIASLRVFPYDVKYEWLMQEYIKAFDMYYQSLSDIKSIINMFNADYSLSFSNVAQYGFSVSPISFDKRILIPNYYRDDVQKSIDSVLAGREDNNLDMERIRKGDEIGSENYMEEGVPFVKTSDIINYDIDYEPDCFCPSYFVSQLEQDVKKGDILFTKDGKPGEVAIIGSECNVVFSSGLVKYHPETDAERYWLFLLLASKYGASYFKKWFVIASTMAHLRYDFFRDFKVPTIDENILEKYIIPLKKAFENKHVAYDIIKKIREKVEHSFTNASIDLTSY